MPSVDGILWRQVTDSDFVCVERSRDNTPPGGGGQTYFSLSFGADLNKEDFGRFLGLDPPDLVVTERPPVSIDAAVLGAPGLIEPIEFRPRYADPADSRDRYYIAHQNRQRENQVRHPAWTAERGFPEAPDDIASKDDPRLPDLSLLKLVVARTVDGTFFADYVNADWLPGGAPGELAVLVEQNSQVGPDGLIDLDPGLDLEELSAIFGLMRRRPRGQEPTSAEIEDARDATARSAGARARTGQGYRQSAEERAAIDLYAMDTATAWFEERGWRVIDHSVNHPYDLLCKRDVEQLHVEVKGTTSDGSAVLLTPNEVAFAGSAFPEMALFVLYGIELTAGEDGNTHAEGGQIDVISPWDIDVHGTLRPTGYSYELTATR